MTKLVDLLDQFKYRRTFGFFDDFDALSSGQRWTADAINSGSVARSAAPAGIVSLVPSGGSPAAHDQTYLATTEPLFAFAADRPLVFEAALQFTEANTNQADVMLGLIAGGVGAGVIQNSGLPQASYTGMVFYKSAGSNVWNCQSSVASAQATTPTTQPSGLADYQTLTGQWQPISATQAEARFFIDGLLVANQLMTFAGVTALQLFAGVANGGSSMETLYLDYLAGYQLR
jgi:hypothetical protein